MYHSNNRIPCLSCDSSRLTIPCSENLVGAVERLLERGIEVVSAVVEEHYLYDHFNGKVQSGRAVLIQIELGFLYSTAIFEGLPPGWLTYEYHTVDEHRQIDPKYIGLSHLEDFIPLHENELEFQTELAISNLKCWLDDRDPASFRAVWILAGVL